MRDPKGHANAERAARYLSFFNLPKNAIYLSLLLLLAGEGRSRRLENTAATIELDLPSAEQKTLIEDIYWRQRRKQENHLAQLGDQFRTSITLRDRLVVCVYDVSLP